MSYFVLPCFLENLINFCATLKQLPLRLGFWSSIYPTIFLFIYRQDQLYGYVICAAVQGFAPRRLPALSLILCHLRLEILHNFVFELIVLSKFQWDNGEWMWAENIWVIFVSTVFAITFIHSICNAPWTQNSGSWCLRVQQDSKIQVQDKHVPLKTK